MRESDSVDLPLSSVTALMNILLVSREYPPQSNFGGIGTYTFGAAHGLRTLGHQVTVLSLAGDEHASDDSSTGVRVVRLPAARGPFWNSWPKLRKFAGVRLLESHAKQVSAWILAHSRSHAFDVVETPDWSGEGAFLCNRASPAHVVRVHGYQRLMGRIHNVEENAIGRRQVRLERRAMLRSDLILPNTRWIGEQLRTDYGIDPLHMRTVYMGIDCDRFAADAVERSAVRAELGVASDAVVYLSCGRVEPRKGFESIIRALGAVLAAKIDAQLVIVGRDIGGESDRLRRVAQSLDLHTRVHLVGGQPYESLHRWFASADIYVGASRGESPGLTYLEAMSSGLPVVALRDGAIPEICPELAAELVAPGSDDDFRGALIRFGANALARRLAGEFASAHVRRFFSLHACIKEQEAAYQEAIRRRRIRMERA